MPENSLTRRRRFLSLTIFQKLTLMTVMLSAVIVGLVILSIVEMDVLSSVRAFVGGEGLWSKAQKQAVYRLSRYVQDRNELDYRQFLNFLRVPLGDHQARLALDAQPFNRELAAQGFLQGGIHAADIPGMIRFYRTFRQVSFAREAINAWRDADLQIDNLLAVGARMHDRVNAPDNQGSDISDLLAEAEKINAVLTPLENSFSEDLSEAARLLDRILLISTLAFMVLFLIFGVAVAWSINRQLSNQIGRLRHAAIRAAEGELNPTLEVEANDEIGDLARAFQAMLTQRNQSQAEIMALNQQLGKRVMELRHANKELESFSYSVSHDLRAPLRAIDGFSRILTEEHQEKLDDESKRLLSVIRRNVDQMSRLIDGLLSFSRLGLHPLKMTAVDLDGLVAEVLAEVKADDPARVVTIHLAPLGIVDGDPVLLKHVWINLLSNAFKFTRRRSEAIISIDRRVENDKIVFSVKDNGAGFDMRFADKLFGVFQRLHGADEFEGTGIGLALVQRIVVRHGGAIWAEGRLGEGASFFFSLPLKA